MDLCQWTDPLFTPVLISLRLTCKEGQLGEPHGRVDKVRDSLIHQLMGWGIEQDIEADEVPEGDPEVRLEGAQFWKVSAVLGFTIEVNLSVSGHHYSLTIEDHVGIEHIQAIRGTGSRILGNILALLLLGEIDHNIFAGIAGRTG